jgi:predicted DNA-binding transcriptional regulator AlpA
VAVKRYLNLRQIADLLGVSYQWVQYLWHTDPEFPQPRIELGRRPEHGWAPEDIDAYVVERDRRRGGRGPAGE